MLYLFAVALLFAVYLGAYSYLRAQINEQISLKRGYMNAAIADTQSFFVSRQMLLKSLGMSYVRSAVLPKASFNQMPAEDVLIRLGNDINNGSLVLTKRMSAYLRESKINLLYVAQRDEPPVDRLFTVGQETRQVPSSVLRRLKVLEASRLPDSPEVWLTGDNAALYIFTPLNENGPFSNWLGLEFQAPDLINALQHEKAGDFMLLDGEGQLIFSCMPYALEMHVLNTLGESASFGWEGGRWLPDRLVIRKQLGYSQWQIIYSVKLGALLPNLGWTLFFCLMLCALTTLSMALLVRRINRRLIIPAANRIQALIESEAFSSAVIKIAPVALCVLRRYDGEVVLDNVLSQRWLGSEQSRKDFCRDWIIRAFEGNDQDNTDEFETSDGRHFYLSFTPTRYHGEDVLICAFSDISARKQVELALEQARTCADEANAAKTLFLATMSHEIRTPLYGVLGTLELLARTELSAQQKNYLNAIEGSSGNLLQMICDVLDVSKIEAGQLSIELSDFSPVQLVQEVIRGYTGAAQSKGLHLFACIDPQLPYQVRGDVTRIRQILSNLLNNAVKFTERGRIVLRVRLESREDERTVLQWQVVDTGCGISPEDQRYLFEPFFQTRGNTNVVAGTGLGLSICKRLMHLMDGKLRVISEPGLGTSFTLSLPLEQIDEDPSAPWALPLQAESVYVVSPVLELSESVAGWLKRWGAKANIGPPENGDPVASAVLVELHLGLIDYSPSPDWRGPRVIAAVDDYATCLKPGLCWQIDLNNLQALNRAVRRAQEHKQSELPVPEELQAAFSLDLHVLVAEDNVINQLILRDQLEELGCTVVLASDGVEALSLWHEEVFDMVLTDVNMPRMNGYELTEQLRRHGCSGPIIGATANALLGEKERCLAAGMDQCLTKPLTLRVLYQCLHHYEGKVL